MNLIFLGPPGAGKGTQAIKASEKFNLPHISTGDIFRSNIKNGTELGIKAKEFLDRGLLVPDALVIEIVEDRLKNDDCRAGFILDGFPRTVNQAEALEGFVSIDKVINIDIDTDILVERLSGRRVCTKCGATYHISTHAGDECGKCGETLIQRPDDQPETVLSRIEVYNGQTKPLIDYYKAKDKLYTVDGSIGIENLFSAITELLTGA